jgi:hypothetical protein
MINNIIINKLYGCIIISNPLPPIVKPDLILVIVAVNAAWLKTAKNKARKVASLLIRRLKHNDASAIKIKVRPI